MLGGVGLSLKIKGEIAQVDGFSACRLVARSIGQSSRQRAFLFFLSAVVLVTMVVSLAAGAYSATLTRTGLVAANALSPSRNLYAVNQSSATRGSISVYDIDRGHNLLKTIPTVSNVDDVKGVAVSAATGKLYVAYRPGKNSDDGTEIFNASTHTSVGLIGSSEDMIEIDFTNGKISRVGDQFRIGRVARD